MRIAHVAPLIESVPPLLYGGTERVVSNLVEELVQQGHDVTLFASGDSRTSARLVPVCDTALRLAGRCQDPVAPHVLMLERVRQRVDQFDIVHFHIGQLHFPLARHWPVRHVTTLHYVEVYERLIGRAPLLRPMPPPRVQDGAAWRWTGGRESGANM